MTLLDKVIAGAIEDSLSTSALLRHMLMLGSRLKSEALVAWASEELNGYKKRAGSELPSYRGPLFVAVQAIGIGESDFATPRKTWRIDERDLPAEHRANMLSVRLYQPLAELEKMASREEAIKIAWSNTQVSRYNRLCRQGEANCPDGFKAEVVVLNVPASMVHGIVDSVRTRALLFALELQQEYPNAGEINGPTTEIERVRESVTNNFNTNIYGGTNSVANGENFTQNVHVEQGDTQALLDFFKEQGLDDAGQAELMSVLEEDGGTPGKGVARFLQRMGEGLLNFGGKVVTPGLEGLAKAAISAHFGVPIA